MQYAMMFYTEPGYAEALPEAERAAVLAEFAALLDEDRCVTAAQLHPAETATWTRDQAMRQAFRAEMDEPPQLMVPSEDPVSGNVGNTFQSWQVSSRDAVLQPPKPAINSSTRILSLAAEHDIEPEAAD